MPDGNNTTMTVSVSLFMTLYFQCNENEPFVPNRTYSWLIDNGAASGPIQISDEDPLYIKSGRELVINSVRAALNGKRYKYEGACGWIQLNIIPGMVSLWLTLHRIQKLNEMIGVYSEAHHFWNPAFYQS